jgi:hypothetical protein
MIFNSTNVKILGIVIESSYIPTHALTMQGLLLSEGD